MAKRGRPLSGKEVDAARAELAEEKKKVVRLILGARGNRVTLDDCIWYAATILNTLESGTKWSRALAEDAVAILRQTKWGAAINLSRSVSPEHFAESFLERFAPSWNWRAQIDDKRHERANERIAAERASDTRTANARLLPYVTPANPSLAELSNLRSIQTASSSSWPTLRTLKLAFAVPERKIKLKIRAMNPSHQEAVTIRLRRRFQGSGGFPMRYDPRIVLSLLEIFIAEWLPEKNYLTSNDKKRFRASAMTVKRALSSKLRPSRSTT
jgi:hypothetical protein